MVSHLDKLLAEHVAVDEHQLVVELEWNAKLAALNVFESV